jgi:hypothetical protein
MLKNQEIIKLIQTKEEAIKQQMDLLLGLYKLNDMRNYRNFNNVFIASVKTIVEILRTNRIHKTGILNNDTVVINGVEETKENVIKLTEMNEDIKNFILDMINKLTDVTKNMKVYFYNNDDDIDNIESARYKYIQQIVDDYIKLLMLIER